MQTKSIHSIVKEKFLRKIFKFLKIFKKKKIIKTIDINNFYPAKIKNYSKKIEPNFFQTFKSSKVDEDHNEKYSNFRKKNPEFNFYFFDDLDMDEYMEKNWSHRKIYKIYKDSIFGASKADIWRYCILYQYGGIYLDFDSSIEFELSTIPNDVSEFISFEKNKISSQISEDYTPDYAFLNNLPKEYKDKIHPENLVIQWLLIYKKNHPILMTAIEEIEKNYEFFLGKKFKSAHMAIVNYTGPVILTKAVRDYVISKSEIYQKGIDFENQVTFKNVSKEGVYFNDESYYKKISDTPILLEKPIRLNLGCGDDLKKEFINIDVVKDNENIVSMNIDDIKNKFQKATIDEIYAKDVIEHVGLPTAKRWIRNWSNLLKKDGTLTIVTTCLDLILEAFSKKLINEEKLNYLLFAGVYWENGKSHWDTEKTTKYDWHKVCFSKELLFKTLKENNFSIISEKYDQINNNINGLNIAIKAKKL